MSLQPNPVAAPAPQKKGCFFYGCLTAIIISIVLILGIWFGVRYVMSNFINEYTQAAPEPLPKLDSSTESYLRVKGKVEAFQEAIRQGKPASIELTASEINTYLASHPGLEGISENFRVSIEGSELQGRLSMPLDQFGYPDRYFNGIVAFTVEMVNGELQAWLRGLKVGNSNISDTLVQQIGGENLLEQVEPEKRKKILEALAGVNSIQIGNGVLKMSGGENQPAK